MIVNSRNLVSHFLILVKHKNVTKISQCMSTLFTICAVGYSSPSVVHTAKRQGIPRITWMWTVDGDFFESGNPGDWAIQYFVVSSFSDRIHFYMIQNNYLWLGNFLMSFWEYLFHFIWSRHKDFLLRFHYGKVIEEEIASYKIQVNYLLTYYKNRRKYNTNIWNNFF